MIDAAIVGFGRWGKTLVDAVQGSSDRLRFTRAVSRDPNKHRDYAAKRGLDIAGELGSVPADRDVDAAFVAATS
jgi:predicted dehydrogenase